MVNTQQQIKNVIVKHYPEIVYDGEIKMGDGEWFDLIIEANKVHGINVNYKDIYNENKPLSDIALIELMAVCGELKIKII